MEIITDLYEFSSYNVMSIINDAACSSDILTGKAAAHALNFLNDIKAASIMQRMLEERVKDMREDAKNMGGQGVVK